MNPPLWISWLLMLIVLALVALIFVALRQLADKHGTSRNTATLVVGALIAWLALTAGLAANGFFRDFQTLPPRFVFGVAPTVLTIVVLSAAHRVRQFLFAAPESWLIAFQAFRIPLEIELWALYSDGFMPIQMTFEGRNFDVIPALLALPVAYFCCVRRSWLRVVAVWWNVLGFVLVVNVAATGALSTPSPFRVFMNEPANTLIAEFPYIWIVTFLVPLALFGHVLSLLQLLTKTR